jgi:hypothetical protein
MQNYWYIKHCLNTLCVAEIYCSRNGFLQQILCLLLTVNFLYWCRFSMYIRYVQLRINNSNFEIHFTSSKELHNFPLYIGTYSYLTSG